MKRTGVLIAGALALVVGAVVAVVATRSGRPPVAATVASPPAATPAQPPPEMHLPTIDATAVVRVELSGAVTGTLVKDAGGWSVIDPARGPAPHAADETKVGHFLQELAALKPGSFVTDQSNRQASLEIDEATGVTVKVIAAAGPVVTLVFGRNAGASGTCLRLAGSPQVFTSTSAAGRIARREIAGWRKSQVFPAAAEDLTRLTTSFEDGTTLTLEAADGGWSLAPGTAVPHDFRFDPAQASRVIGALTSLKAVDYGDSLTDANAGLTGAHLHLRAERKSGPPIVVQVGSRLPLPDGGAPSGNSLQAVKVEGDPQSYLVPAFTVDAVSRHVTDLRDLSLLSFDPADATELTLRSGPVVTRVTRVGDDWVLSEPKQMPPHAEYDPKQVVNTLAALKALHAARWESVTPAAAGLEPTPLVTVEIKLRDGKSRRLLFGTDVPGLPAGQVYVQGSKDKLVYTVPAGVRAHYQQGVEIFRHLTTPGPGAGLEALPPDVRAKVEAQLHGAH